jgi:hypothetical protein
MAPKQEYSIRTMSLREVDLAVEWADAEGWNPGLHDAGCFYAADHEGFLVGLLGSEPVAAISVVRYGSSFGFLGFYIVRREYRGMGFGLRIWNAGLARLQGRTVGLDGVLSQQDNYRKSGFSLAYRNIRYQCIGGGRTENSRKIVPLKCIPFEDLRAYDVPFFPDDRRAFLQCWINSDASTALGLLQNGSLAGYGVIRKCRTGYKIGPLFADSAIFAETLFSALKACAPGGSPVFLDIPEVNPEAINLVKRHHMSVVFETARMYKGTFPKLTLGRIYGVTSFELG